MTGSSYFKRTGIIINYTHVDLDKNQVTATICHEEDIKLTVTINTDTGDVQKVGSMDEILQISPSEDEDFYIEVIREWAEIFISKKIIDPQAYFSGNYSD
ncbi:hypothetical protein ABNX05_25670 [Lysinibacillus sp. M3]|uniref:Uncharacterized protein n=1 Tax=Lysinibacillus zambalensis TaxID=3160866 RepID=A0ABV1MZQ3_9BACI